MAITTVNGIVAGFKPPQSFIKTTTTMEAVGTLTSLFYRAGLPGAAATPSPGVNGAPLTTYAGQVPFTNPVSGNTYLAGLEATASTAGTLLLCDRLWHNSGLSVTSTSPQSVSSTTWPSRDANGSISGESVYVGLEFSTASTGTNANTVTINYVDQGGFSGVGTLVTTASAQAVDTFYIMNLGAGDTGVGSITDYTNSVSMLTGVIHLVAFRILARIPVGAANVSTVKDFAALGLPRLYNDTVPFFLWLPSSTAATTIQGQLTYTQG